MKEINYEDWQKYREILPLTNMAGETGSVKPIFDRNRKRSILCVG